MNFKMMVFFCAAAGWLAGPARAEKAAAGKESGRHLLVQLALEKGSVRVVKVTRVAAPLPKRRGGPLAHETWRLTVRGERGERLHQAWISDPRWVQAELPDPKRPEDVIHARALVPEPVEFAVRVPDVPRARLALEMRQWEGDRQIMQFVGNVELPEGRP